MDLGPICSAALDASCCLPGSKLRVVLGCCLCDFFMYVFVHIRAKLACLCPWGIKCRHGTLDELCELLMHACSSCEYFPLTVLLRQQGVSNRFAAIPKELDPIRGLPGGQDRRASIVEVSEALVRLVEGLAFLVDQLQHVLCVGT